MSIKQISLRNFKCFTNVDLTLSKITLLTGENSSGKSSLLYGLLAPFQSQQFPLFLSPNGKYVNMGDFMEMSFNNSKASLIGIDLLLNIGKDEYNIATNWAFDSENKMPKLNSLKVISPNYNLSMEDNRESGYLLNIDFFVKDRLQREHETFVNAITSFLSAFGVNDAEKAKSIEHATALFSDKEIKNHKIPTLENLDRSLEKSENLHGLLIINELIGNCETIDKNINFISSFRLQPERTYYQQGKSKTKIGTLGENYIDQILEWEDKNPDKFKKLKSNLNMLDLLRTIKTKQLRGGRFELRVQVRPKGIWALLNDVGFGISQFLPILVADLQLSNQSILMIEQPEIHLHPSVQANLADYFIEQVTKTEKRYVIETHSEYLLNRFRLLIAKGTINPSDVSVYFFENSLDGTKKYQIELTKDGKILKAPKKFFETYMIDVMRIAMHSK
jgi:predicted ATPase